MRRKGQGLGAVVDVAQQLKLVGVPLHDKAYGTDRLIRYRCPDFA